MSLGDRAIKNASKISNIPLSYAAGMPRIEIMGFDLLRIEEHRGLLEYGGEQIAIRGTGANIIVRGKNLQLEMMNPSEMILRGDIYALEFEHQA